MKELILLNSQGGKLAVEAMPDGSLWNNGKKIFDSDDDVKLGWKIDAVKVIMVKNEGKSSTE